MYLGDQRLVHPDNYMEPVTQMPIRIRGKMSPPPSPLSMISVVIKVGVESITPELWSGSQSYTGTSMDSLKYLDYSSILLVLNAAVVKEYARNHEIVVGITITPEIYKYL